MIKKLIFILLLFQLLVCLGCSKGPKSYQELKDMGIFPERVGEQWELSSVPRSALNLSDKGYIAAIYQHSERYGILLIWIVDKVNAEGANEWLARLIEGTHTSSTIKPLRLDAAVIQLVTDAREQFSYCDHFINGIQGYEMADLSNNHYKRLYTQGRYVVGIDDSHGVKSIQEKRRLLWPVLENLNLSQ